MPTARDDAERLLEEYPELEGPLGQMLEVDADGPWEFDDVPVDTGQFGKIVASGVVEKTGDGYRVADPEALGAVLDSPEAAVESSDTGDGVSSALALGVPDFTWPLSKRTTLSLAGLLAFVVVLRVVFVYDSVYRETITLVGNDPYKRLYWIEQLQAEYSPVALDSLPEGVSLDGDTLMLVAAWWASELLGGTVTSARTVLAWYPVLAAVVTAVTVFEITRQLTDDIRVALASVLMLAVTPVHAYRTVLGFGDHHAFDYIWLGLTVLVMVRWERLVAGTTPPTRDRLGEWRFQLTTVALGVLLAIQSLSWVGAPMLLVPFVLYTVLRGAFALRGGTSPLVATLPYIGGGLFAGVLVLLVHASLGWLPGFRALFPLVAVVVATVGVGYLEATRRSSLSPRAALTSGAATTLLAGVLAVTFVPGMATALKQASGLFQEQTIAESASLFTTELGVLGGPLPFFGFILFLALPFVAVGLYRALTDNDPTWAIPAVYGVYFLFWSLVKVRFAGPLSLFTAVFAGVGFLRLAALVDLARPVQAFGEQTGIDNLPSLSGRQVASVAVLFLLVASLALIQTPIKQDQLAIGDDTYDTARWIDQYAEDNGLDYPDNGVFSQWDTTRFYNYFVNGQSDSYFYERNFYSPFLGSTDPGGWYERLRGRYGFVLYAGQRNDTEGPTIENRMMGEGQLPSFGHYRLVYDANDGPQKVFQLVEGATIVGVANSSGTVTAGTQASVGSETRTYQREVRVNPDGVYSVRVPYSGTYTVADTEVTVTKRAIVDGRREVLHSRTGLAHWPFDEANDTIVYDRVGGHRGVSTNVTTVVDGYRGRAVQFDGDGYIVTDVDPVDQFTVSMWVKPAGTEADGFQSLLRGREGVFVLLNDGNLVVDLPGVSDEPLRGGKVPNGTWTQVAVTYDGAQRTLYVNGTEVASDRPSGGPAKWTPPLSIGGETNRDGDFTGTIDEVRLYDRALSAAEVERLAGNGTS
ncbi:hypothetical protein HZS55_05895 [Halosimplex rubrum]|uniref:dolichyl-phosphooligosaccharide-protein glycotransferase n=1 Tax=Halosimplex rubrum TaxID=869889 RepID=A0A7D5NYY5_9EURY|nr:LamG-like jellyroll fold domain-containing protein [Halosimplex rubrum]QLH76863.1 hypothetical protein HZS55_05895 [Halosimplex rubrum]